jgi:hypothetical protein
MDVDIREWLAMKYPGIDVGRIVEIVGEDRAEAADALARLQQETAARAPAPAQLGAPVAPANSATAAPTDYEMQLRKWQLGVRTRNKFAMTPYDEVEAARWAFFVESWNTHDLHRKRGHGNVSDAPRFVAPAQQPQLPLPGQARV